MGSKFLLEIFQKENSLLILFFSINDEKKLKLISRLIESIFNNDIQFLVRRDLDNGNLKLPPAVIHQIRKPIVSNSLRESRKNCVLPVIFTTN